MATWAAKVSLLCSAPFWAREVPTSWIAVLIVETESTGLLAQIRILATRHSVHVNLGCAGANVALEGHIAAAHLFPVGGYGTQLCGIQQRIARPEAQSPEEALFLESMKVPANLQIYQEKPRDNIKKLFDWVGRIEKAIPAVNVRIWSEGEENLEARLDEILAVR